MSAEKQRLRVLIVENAPDDVELVIDHLQEAGFAVTAESVESADEMTRALREREWDAIISDFLMPAFTGLDALQIAKEFELGIPFVIVSGSIGEDIAVQAMRAGADDYIMKDRMGRLGAAVERALQDSRMRRERKQMQEDLRRQAEELRNKADSLERTNRELESFAYLAAHDLQEPLRMVTSFAELLVKRYRERLDPDVDQIVGFVQSGVNRMEALISGLLAYSETLREDAPTLCPTSLNRVVAEAIESKNPEISQNGADVKVGDLPEVLGDTGKLRTLFEHLIANAIKFRKPNVPPRINIQGTVRGEEAVVSVADNGIGIDPQYSKQIFGLFKRLHRDDEIGLGMGLALCRRIVEQHGGSIGVESTVGHGATFRVTFKAVPHGSRAAEAPSL